MATGWQSTSSIRMKDDVYRKNITNWEGLYHLLVQEQEACRPFHWLWPGGTQECKKAHDNFITMALQIVTYNSSIMYELTNEVEATKDEVRDVKKKIFKHYDLRKELSDLKSKLHSPKRPWWKLW